MLVPAAIMSVKSMGTFNKVPNYHFYKQKVKVPAVPTWSKGLDSKQTNSQTVKSNSSKKHYIYLASFINIFLIIFTTNSFTLSESVFSLNPWVLAHLVEPLQLSVASGPPIGLGSSLNISIDHPINMWNVLDKFQ